MLLPLPDDFHAHLRQGDLMPAYVRDLVSQFGRAIIMPNTIPAMTSAKAIAEYKAQILDAAKSVRPDFVPLMTFKLNPNYTEQDLKDMMAVGVVAGKYYPAGVTTNSADGISDFEAVFPVVAMMEKLGLVLCVHGEEPGEFCLDREPAFIKRVETLAEKFPNLKIVFEHLSSAKSVEAVKRLPANVAATITVHHLMMTLDDIVGDALRPHHFCKPLPKRPEDRAAIREAAFSGSPKFFLGTDSAPHQLSKRNVRAERRASTAPRWQFRCCSRNSNVRVTLTSFRTSSQDSAPTSTVFRAPRSRSKWSRNSGPFLPSSVESFRLPRARPSTGK